MDKDFYNESSSAKLGWEPHWFGCDEFDDDLVEAIAKYQKKNRFYVSLISLFLLLPGKLILR